MVYDEGKVKEFNNWTIEEYEGSLSIEEICKVNLVEQTDGTFEQVGIRPSLDDDFLISPSFDSRLPGAGRIVAIGERDFLINELVNNPKINVEKFTEDIKEFPKHIYDFDGAVILLSTKFFVEVSMELANRIDYEEGYQRLDRRYKIISVPEKILGNRIIIVGKDAIVWEKKVFDNAVTGTKEKLDIVVKPKVGGMVEIIIRSLNKIKFVDEDLIKILEVGEIGW